MGAMQHDGIDIEVSRERLCQLDAQVRAREAVRKRFLVGAALFAIAGMVPLFMRAMPIALALWAVALLCLVVYVGMYVRESGDDFYTKGRLAPAYALENGGMLAMADLRTQTQHPARYGLRFFPLGSTGVVVGNKRRIPCAVQLFPGEPGAQTMQSFIAKPLSWATARDDVLKRFQRALGEAAWGALKKSADGWPYEDEDHIIVLDEAFVPIQLRTYSAGVWTQTSI